MRPLLDESVPSRLRRFLASHNVKTVVHMGWSGVTNGKLLALGAADFDVFLTVDKNLRYQQSLATLPLAVVVLDAYSNELAALLPLVPELEQQVFSSLRPRSYVKVGTGA